MTADGSNLAIAQRAPAPSPPGHAKVVLEARDIVKELGQGARKVACPQGREIWRCAPASSPC